MYLYWVTYTLYSSCHPFLLSYQTNLIYSATEDVTASSLYLHKVLHNVGFLSMLRIGAKRG